MTDSLIDRLKKELLPPLAPHLTYENGIEVAIEYIRQHTSPANLRQGEISYNNMQGGEFLQAVGMDGKLWTDAFMEMWGNRLNEVDHGLMLGWFCNAIMAGYDEATRRANKPVSVSLMKCCDALAKAVPYPLHASIGDTVRAVLDAAGVKYVD